MNLELLNYIDYESCIAIIPARGGSKTVPKKNIRRVWGHPLVAYSIVAAKLTKRIQRVIVSTDSLEIGEIARAYGADVPFLRPSKYAQDNSADIDFMRHAIQWLYENEGKIPEYIVHMRPTTPIRSPQVIDDAIFKIQSNLEATSLRSGHLCHHPPYKWFKDNGKYWGPLISGMTCDEVNMPRQDFPAIYIPNGYVDIVKTDFIIKSDLMHGDKMIGYITNEIPDIDTEMDLKKLLAFDDFKEDIITLRENLEDRCRGSKDEKLC